MKGKPCIQAVYHKVENLYTKIWFSNKETQSSPYNWGPHGFAKKKLKSRGYFAKLQNPRQLLQMLPNFVLFISLT